MRRIFSSYSFALLLIIILLIGAVVRISGYNFGLPYVDHPDEPNFILAAQSWIDTGSTRFVRMEGYPPGIITVDFLTLKWFPVGSAPPASALPLVRLLSIVANLGAAAAVAVLAREAAGSGAGLFAAAVWMLSPLLVTFSRFATADPFITVFFLWSLALTLIGTRLNRPILLNLSLIAALLAITFKYQAVFLLPFTLGVPLIRLFNTQANRRRVISDAVWHTIVVGVFFFWLIFIYEAGKATSVPYWVAPTEHVGVPPLDRLTDGVRLAIGGVSHALIWIVSLIGAVGWMIDPKAEDRRMLPVFVIMLAAIAYLIGVNLFGDQEFRQYIALVGLLTALQGIGIVGWVSLLRRVPLLAARASVLVGGAGVLMLIPLLIGAVENARQFSLPDRRVDLMRYMDTSLPPAPIIATYDLHKVTNREWGGYPGIHHFPLVEVANIAARPFREWRRMGVQYAVMSLSDWEAVDPAYRTGRLILLKSYPESPDYRGDNLAVVCLCDVGLDSAGSSAPALGSIYYRTMRVRRAVNAVIVSYYWQTVAPLDGDYAVFNHLIDENGQIVSQADGSPLFDPRRTTDTWDDPNEILISQPFRIVLDGLPPGRYTIHTGFYRRDNNMRLTSDSGGDYVPVNDMHDLVILPP